MHIQMNVKFSNKFANWVKMGKLLGMFTLSTLTISTEILMIIAKIDEFKGAWQALGTLAPERLFSLRRVATIESIGSSTRIEGSRLSDRDVEKLLWLLEIRQFDTRDEQEVAGYAEVMELVFSSWQHIAITENHIQQLHRDLLQFSTKDEYHRGWYKITANHVGAFDEDGHQIAVIFETATPFDTPPLMTELIAWYNREYIEKTIHPLIAIAGFIVVFLEIHPFQDGNGRLSRILTMLLLLRAGYAYVPYSSLEAVIEQNKQAYYLALRQTQWTIRTGSPRWEPWIHFFLRSLASQVIRLEEKVTHEKLVLASVSTLSLSILDLAKKQGRITIHDVVIMSDANRNTIKKHLSQLTQAGQLQKHGAGRWVWYSLAGWS
jgi:Fic family protein